jgi:YidC/Oxa1 family membrane protein insertase
MLLTANIFQPLIDVFQSVLTFFHDSIGVSWGWSIVLLTIAIRAILIPLTVKQFHSMQRLQAHMPELKELQARYKDDKQRQQQEVMKFYQENKVNPFGSCLPLAAQLPVFISLFYMLRQSLRHDICPDLNPLAHAAKTLPCGTHGHAGFLFISDLTNKATGATLVVLLVLYIGTQLGSSLMAAQPTMDRNQRLMMLGLPLVFVFIVIGFPAGLLVYWITTNTWTMAQQYVIKKRIGPPPVAVAGSTSSTGASGGGRGGSGGTASPKPSPTPSAGGFAARLLGRASTNGEPPAGEVAKRPRGPQAAPPPSPRKKKKRSGRRR